MRKLTTQIKVRIDDQEFSLEEKIKDMLFRMYCSCEDEALFITAEDTSVTTLEGILPGLTCNVRLNGIKELSETDLYTFLEEHSFFNKHMLVDEYGNISLKFDTKIDK
jgi:hypothetical protein